MPSDNDFQLVQQHLADGGISAACDELVSLLRQNGQYHEMFDARLMQCRQKLGLPLVADTQLDDLPEPLRQQLEDSYLDACREVGQLLLGDGQVRQAWMYLRPAGEQKTMSGALDAIEPNDENIDELLEIAIYEGVNLDRGFQLVLNHYGTCNAITTYESTMHSRTRSEQQLAAAILVKWLHKEVLSNLAADLGESVNDFSPEQMPLRQFVDGKEEYFGEFTTHIDVSHLHSVVRFTQIIENPDILMLALDLTEYGCRLHENLQHAGEAPFSEHFLSHRLFFAAQLGQREEEALTYFHKQALAADPQLDSTRSAEIYITLLARLKRFDEAMNATISLVPAGQPTSGLAPSLLDLSRAAGSYDILLKTSRERGDLVSFAIGRMEEALRQESS